MEGQAENRSQRRNQREDASVPQILDCFAGIGGFSLAAHLAGCEVRAQIEIDEFKREHLKRRFPNAKKFKDIRTVSVNDIRRLGKLWAVVGGFPCQDISQASRETTQGLAGSRSGLWRYMWRIIDAARPHFVLVENVPNLRLHGADSVLLSLEAIGYTPIAFVVGAWNVLAPHKRNRVWILGYRSEIRRKEQVWETEGRRRRLAEIIRASLYVSAPGGVISYPYGEPLWQPGEQLARQKEAAFAFPLGPGFEQRDWEAKRWISESSMGSAIDGLPPGMAGPQLQAYGDAIVPQVAAPFFEVMFELETLLEAA